MAEEEENGAVEGMEGFPGLNKRHGFFKAIQRNQLDRDTYHRQHEEVKKSRSPVADKRERPAEKRKPALQLYHPPHHRGRRQTPTKEQTNQKKDLSYKSDALSSSYKSDTPDINSSKLDTPNVDSSKSEASNVDLSYTLEVELSPGEWHSVLVQQRGNSQGLASELAARVKMAEHMRQALAEMIDEFEQKLTTAEL